LSYGRGNPKWRYCSDLPPGLSRPSRAESREAAVGRIDVHLPLW